MDGMRICPGCNGSGHVPVPDPAARGYFFGCWGRSGHYLFVPGGCSPSKDEIEALPRALRRPDGTLAPGRRRYLNRPADVDSEDQVEGLAALHYVEGWTALSLWDRSVDTRLGSNSTFIVRGTLSFDEMLERSRALFPSIWARFKFAVRLAEVAS